MRAPLRTALSRPAGRSPADPGAPAPPSPTRLPSRRAAGWAVAALALLVALPEALLTLADLGLVGTASWRPWAYQNGAFWSGLLRDWRPNYAAQPVLMFVTYAVLHAGPGHLLGNLAGLAWFGPPLARRLGWARLLLAFWATAIGGALAFGLLSREGAPMVGASGAVFGLAGVAMTRGWRDRVRAGLSAWPALAPSLGMALLLVVVNLASWWWEDGLVAWQTHLGGALTGAALGLWLGRGRGPQPTPLRAAPQRGVLGPILAKMRS